MTPRNTVETSDRKYKCTKRINTVITYLYKKPQLFDTLQGTVGAYASTLKVYDPIRKLEEITHI